MPGQFVLDVGAGPQTLVAAGHSPVLVEGRSVLNTVCRIGTGPVGYGWVSWIA